MGGSIRSQSVAGNRSLNRTSVDDSDMQGNPASAEGEQGGER